MIKSVRCFFLRLRESEINFVFCEWVLYVGTAPEQKTESAKNGKDSMSLPKKSVLSLSISFLFFLYIAYIP